MAEVLVPWGSLYPQMLDCCLPLDAGIMVNPAGFLVIKLMPLDYLADSGLGDALHSFTFTKFIKKGFDLFFAQLRIFLSELPYELDNPYGYQRCPYPLGSC